MSQPEWAVVGRREFTVRVRSKWFIIVTMLGPLGMLALILIPAYLSAKGEEAGAKIHIVDHSDAGIGVELAKYLPLDLHTEAEVVDAATPTDELMRRIRDEEIDGFLEVPDNVLDSGLIGYKGANASNFSLIREIEGLLQLAVQRERGRREEIDPKRLNYIIDRVNLVAEHTTGSREAVSGAASFFLGYAVMFVLYMSILLYAVNVMRSVVEEKSSRVVEVLVSSVKPMPLMLGKILGVGSVGLLQLAIWIGMGVLIYQYRFALLGLFGVTGGTGLMLPSLGADVVFVILAYFFLGYFLYAALYAAIGAMVNSEHEAQQMQTPVVLLLIIPVMSMQVVANDPRGGIAELLTMIPFASPVLMPMRYLLGGASMAQVAVSLALLVATLFGVAWLAARVYRVGILMYGKRPTLREIGRWIRHS